AAAPATAGAAVRATSTETIVVWPSAASAVAVTWALSTNTVASTGPRLDVGLVSTTVTASSGRRPAGNCPALKAATPTAQKATSTTPSRMPATLRAGRGRGGGPNPSWAGSGSGAIVRA